MPGVLGIKKYKCDIIIREDERFDIETFIHENLHSRSVSLYPEKDRKNVYESNRRIEEGTIEFLAQEICNKSNVPFIGSYDDYVEALRDIKRIIAPMQNDYDFGRSLIEIPLHERYNHLKKSVEIYKQSRSRIRKIVIERLDEDLANLFGGD